MSLVIDANSILQNNTASNIVTKKFPKLMNWSLFIDQLKILQDRGCIFLTGKNSPYDAELLTAILRFGHNLVIAIQWCEVESVAVYRMSRQEFDQHVGYVDGVHASDIKIRMALKDVPIYRRIPEYLIHSFMHNAK